MAFAGVEDLLQASMGLSATTVGSANGQTVVARRHEGVSAAPEREETAGILIGDQGRPLFSIQAMDAAAIELASARDHGTVCADP